MTLFGLHFLTGEVYILDETITAHKFLLGTKSNEKQIIGVIEKNKVKVVLPDKRTDTLRPDPHDLRIVEATLKPVGRLTICGTKGRSERETRIDTDVVAEMLGREMQMEMGETVFTFDVISDRDIEGVYVALFLYHVNSPDDVSVDFGSIGDLPKGELVSREIYFPNTTVSEGMEYRFEFYSGGDPLEMYMLQNVACNPASRGLNIPWSIRLNCYLNTGEKEKMTENPRPWKMGFTVLDLTDYRARGAKDLKITIRVRDDGNVDLVEGDPRLTPKELADLEADINQWEFFPELKKGDPQDKLVAVPLRM